MSKNTHGTPQLDEDAAKLRALGVDPGPTWDEMDDDLSDGSCANCGGEGVVPGCFEDTCVCGAEDDPHGCCSPRRCDWCNGKG